MLRAELETIAQKERDTQAKTHCRVLCCGSTACVSSGGDEIKKTLQDTIKAAGLQAKVSLVTTGCKGLCSRGPLVTIHQDGQPDIYYADLTPETAARVVNEHLVAGQPVAECEMDSQSPFFTSQVRVVLDNSGMIDPERIEDYIAHGGYQALGNVLRDMTPEQVCEAMTKSGLRGRGGGGYPTGLKWNLVRKAPGDKKYVVANGDEGDPGAYMDRTLMESDPHRVLEGMALAAYAVGADQGFIYVRAEYPLAVKRLEKAIKAAERLGLLGSRIFESNFNFRVDLRIGAGAFVCGEETALMNSVMGRRGEPRPRPPYPAQSGLWGHPTLVNNVETFGNIAPILLKGAEWYASMGTAKSKGTKIFALTGDVNNTGLIEVPMGISLRDIVYKIGGGIPGGKQFKAAQTGGPSGGCIPADYLDTPIDYESLGALGSIMGSGGLIIMDEDTSMVDIAKFYMEFCMDESCGKCIPCRAGTAQMHHILSKVLAGQATRRDLALLEELCTMVQATSLCGLGQTAPNPVVSTLRYFRSEYETKLKDAPRAPQPEVA